MLKKSKRMIVAVVAAGVVSLIPGSTPAIAMAPCQGRTLASVIEYSQIVAVTGQYAATGATDVQLTCGIVKNGKTIQRVSESNPGPLAVVAATMSVTAGTYSLCYEAEVTYLDQPPASFGTCP
jgi:hypothetical protein